MGKFKESETANYIPENEYTDQHFVQPTFVGLIEIFKNFSFSFESDKEPEAQDDQSLFSFQLP